MMSLFQKTIELKYLQQLDAKLIESKYNLFRSHFANPEIQENIRCSKEEQYQGEFLIDLFVNVLGYTKHPSPNFNLTTEYRNIKDAKKADGAIIISEQVKAVIELKGTDTTDLGKVESQAFGYKNNQSDCTYVIISNFEKLRFYIDNAIEYQEFNLFTLTRAEFDLLYLCLSFESICKDIPKRIKAESLSQEDKITKQLYCDYSQFKRALFQDLTELNKQFDNITLFKKSQKLLDRFLFLLFAEDRQLLPPNSVRLILNDWKDLKDRDVEIPLYDRFKKYFEYLNTGYKGKRYDVFAYNGGLFKPDEILDNVKIDDELLYKHTLKLSEYDFVSEVDVNILGHIFENSLNELDELKARQEGVEIDKSKTKRKKDGVFYTPKYITKYIVENTVGKLCSEKKAELQMVEEEFTTDKRRNIKTKKALLDKLQDYRDWLLQLTICDPACGSGAFLNQALDFLMNEHKYIDELQAKVYGASLIMSDIEKSILENNLFGVDLNEESVEIAKLSLWLRTAQPNRKLNDLNNNIKCGNSLIDDPAVAGDKAFNWQKEFPQVFEKGGFDVVIGNPPYGGQLLEIEKRFLENNYNTFEYQINTYVVFYERGIKILKTNGLIGFITPATFTYQHYFKKLREFIQHYCLIGICKYFYEVFEDADIGDSVSWIMRKSLNDKKRVFVQLCRNKEDALLSYIEKNYEEVVLPDGLYNLNVTGISLNKFYENCYNLGDISEIIVGIKAYQTGKGEPKQTQDIVEKKIFNSNHKLDNTFIQCTVGRDFYRYTYLQEPCLFLSYGKWLAEPRESAPFFEKEKIILRQTSDSLIAHIDDKRRINLNNVYNVGRISEFSVKYILALLNSKVLNFIYQNISQEKGRLFAEVKKVNLIKLPIKKANADYQLIIENLAIQLIHYFQDLQDISQKFQRTIQRKFNIEALPSKLQDWYKLSFLEFIAELGKKKIKLSLSQESEWEDYFMQEATKALDIKARITTTDKEIDLMVYKLYELTEEEIAIVENS